MHLSDRVIPDNVSVVALSSGESDKDVSVVTVTVRRGGIDDELDEDLEVSSEDGIEDGEGDSDSSESGDESEGSDD